MNYKLNWMNRAIELNEYRNWIERIQKLIWTNIEIESKNTDIKLNGSENCIQWITIE